MNKVDYRDFEGNSFKKQLAYYNRTFLIGYYNFMSGAEKFEVVKEGKIWEFSSLVDACNKFNEVSGV